MKVLVTGGAGFIGSWLVDSLLQKDHSVTIVDNLSPQIHGEMASLDLSKLKDNRQSVDFIHADIRNMEAMDKALAQSDAVVHLAAETGTGQSMYQVAHYYDVNQQATAAMFEAIVTKHRHIKRVVLASSRAIYGEGAYLLDKQVFVPGSRDPLRLQNGQFEPLGPNGELISLIATPENSLPSPASIYAATKLANESLGRIMAEAYGLTVVALRFQNVYGERQSLRNPYTGILSIFSNRMRQNLPINIFEDGQESRDFIHVSDVVRSIQLALEKELPRFTVANVGSGIPTTVWEVANLLRKLLNSSSQLYISGDFRSGDIRHCYADMAIAEKQLDFRSSIDIKSGLKVFSEWVMTQPLLVDRSVEAMAELTKLGLGKCRE